MNAFLHNLFFKMGFVLGIARFLLQGFLSFWTVKGLFVK